MRQAILYKQRQKSFAVTSNVKDFKIPQYNALKDPFLIGFFDNPSIKKHLKQAGLTRKKFRVNRSTSRKSDSNQRPKTTQLSKKLSHTSRSRPTHPLKLPALQDYLPQQNHKRKVNNLNNLQQDNSKQIKKSKRKSSSVNKRANDGNKMWASMRNQIKIGQIQKENIQNQEEVQDKSKMKKHQEQVPLNNNQSKEQSKQKIRKQEESRKQQDQKIQVTNAILESQSKQKQQTDTELLNINVSQTVQKAKKQQQLNHSYDHKDDMQQKISIEQKKKLTEQKQLDQMNQVEKNQGNHRSRQQEEQKIKEEPIKNNGVTVQNQV